MKSVIQILIYSTLIFTDVAFAQAPVAPATPTAPVRVKLNGLERGEAARRQMNLKMSQQRLASDQKVVSNASAKVSAAVTPKDQEAAAAKLAAAQKRLEVSTKAVLLAQATVDDWTTSTLKAHHADAGKYKVDWQSGQVSSK